MYDEKLLRERIKREVGFPVPGDLLDKAIDLFYANDQTRGDGAALDMACKFVSCKMPSFQ